MNSEISVILPAYNEGAVIASSIREVACALADKNYEIVVVDDGSADDTAARAQQAADENSRVKVVHYQPNRGKGYALRQGFATASGDLIAFLDADADLHPRQLLTLWNVMEQKRADAVIGSKRHRESQLDYPLARRVVSWGYFTMAHFLFGLPVRDTQTGIKLFRREVLEQVFPNLQIEGFAFDLELLVAIHLYGYSIAEAPVVLTFGRGKARPLDVLRASLEVALDTLRVFYRVSFWKWLSPGLSFKVWALILLGGLIAGSISLGHLLNNFVVPPPLDAVVNILLLRFLERTLRDGIIVCGGVLLVIIAALQLNKQIVAAFARKGRTDILERKESESLDHHPAEKR